MRNTLHILALVLRLHLGGRKSSSLSNHQHEDYSRIHCEDPSLVDPMYMKATSALTPPSRIPGNVGRYIGRIVAYDTIRGIRHKDTLGGKSLVVKIAVSSAVVSGWQDLDG